MKQTCPVCNVFKFVPPYSNPETIYRVCPRHQPKASDEFRLDDQTFTKYNDAQAKGVFNGNLP